MARRLVHVPVVHDAADLGGLAASVRDAVVRAGGDAAWERHVRAIDAYWAGVRDAVDRLCLRPPEVRLYQDSLPVCGRERELVRDQAAAGSHNHRLLEELIGLGAGLTGTESPGLLVEQLELARELAAGPPAGDWKRRADDLLARRDAFIAGRVAGTLRPGETGLVFLGALHALEGRLPEDIALERLAVAPRGV